jgi:hypothetical protein
LEYIVNVASPVPEYNPLGIFSAGRALASLLSEYNNLARSWAPHRHRRLGDTQWLLASRHRGAALTNGQSSSPLTTRDPFTMVYVPLAA